MKNLGRVFLACATSAGETKDFGHYPGGTKSIPGVGCLGGRRFRKSAFIVSIHISLVHR
jgi:hypothetical protein